MERYPKFLNSSPKFWGLTLPDILLFALGLNVFYHLGVPVLVALLAASVFALLRKLIVKWIDLKALLISLPRVRSFSWQERVSSHPQNRGGRL